MCRIWACNSDLVRLSCNDIFVFALLVCSSCSLLKEDKQIPKAMYFPRFIYKIKQLAIQGTRAIYCHLLPYSSPYTCPIPSQNAPKNALHQPHDRLPSTLFSFSSKNNGLNNNHAAPTFLCSSRSLSTNLACTSTISRSLPNKPRCEL